MEPQWNALGRMLKQQRIQNLGKRSLPEFAKGTGISPRTFFSLESGEGGNFRDDTLLLLAPAYELNPTVVASYLGDAWPGLRPEDTAAVMLSTLTQLPEDERQQAIETFEDLRRQAGQSISQ